jgi:hypothetical protein
MQEIEYWEDVDLARLQKSNGLADKWHKYFGISENYKFKFFINMMKNKEEYLEKLPSEKQDEFKSDYKNMFYAKLCENAILKKYYYLILYLIRKFQVDSQYHDHYLDLGLLSIRHSIWSFLDIEKKSGLTTYVYAGIFRRFMGEKGKIIIKTKRKKYIKIKFASELKSASKDDRCGFENVLAVAQESVSELEELETNSVFSEIIASANLDADEKVLLNLYMQRDNIQNNWNLKYFEYHKLKFGKSITKQAIYNKLFKTQRKIWSIYTKKFNLPYQDDRLRFLNNSNTRKSKKYIV